MEDSIKTLADGELWVKPVNADGSVISDPYSIFENPGLVRDSGLVSKLGEFPEAKDHILLGNNLVVDLGRQSIAYLIGGKDFDNTTPNKNWIVTQSSWGTYDEVPRFTDSSLSPQAAMGITAGANEIAYRTDSGVPKYKKPIFSVDWPQPFIVRFEILLGTDEANGYLLREMALWTNNTTLFARKAFPAVEKTSAFGLSFLWRVRC